MTQWCHNVKTLRAAAAAVSKQTLHGFIWLQHGFHISTRSIAWRIELGTECVCGKQPGSLKACRALGYGKSCYGASHHTSHTLRATENSRKGYGSSSQCPMHFYLGGLPRQRRRDCWITWQSAWKKCPTKKLNGTAAEAVLGIDHIHLFDQGRILPSEE